MEKGLELVLVSLTLIATVGGFWIWPIFLGIKTAKEKGRSPHWMWFGVYPIGGWIALAVLRSLPAPNTPTEQHLADSSLLKANPNSALERQTWFWILWPTCLLAQLLLGLVIQGDTTNHPMIAGFSVGFLFLSGFSLIPLTWFILGDYAMNKWWVAIALIHPILLIVPVGYHLFTAKRNHTPTSA